jgi:hypothetical protein
MPLPPKKPPVLTAAEETAARTAFYHEIVDELVIEGRDTDEHRKIALALATEAKVVSKFAGPQVGYNTNDELMLNAKRVARLVVQTATMRGFGPDPVALLVDRLMKLGVPQDDAEYLAKGKVGRHPDGRVWARDGMRELYDGGRAVVPGVSKPEEIARATDPNEALTRATRVLIQRYRDAQKGSPDSGHVNRVLSAF